jgi:hypothetical protein
VCARSAALEVYEPTVAHDRRAWHACACVCPAVLYVYDSPGAYTRATLDADGAPVFVPVVLPPLGDQPLSSFVSEKV